MNFAEVANSWPIWAFAMLSVCIILLQSGLFTRLALKNAKSLGLTKKQCTKALKNGAITAIGPSIATAFAVLSLVAVVGAPIAWIRLSMIGAVPTELGAASIGALVSGKQLGGEGYDMTAMAVVWFTMALNGCGWLIVTLLTNHKSEAVRKKITGGDTIWLGIFSLTSLAGIVGYSLSTYTVTISSATSVAAIVGFIVSVTATKLSKKYKWLKEWILGFGIVAGLAVGCIFL